MVGALDLGFTYGYSGNGCSEILKKTQEGKVKILYLFNADEINLDEIGRDTFVIYHGHHGDKSVNRADVILPSAAYTEQDGIYVNIEGRPQYARRAVPPPGQAFEDWRIITDIAKQLKISQWPKTLAEVRNQMAQENPVFANVGEITPASVAKITIAEPTAASDEVLKQPLQKNKFIYYMTDAISRSSSPMAKCTKMIAEVQMEDIEDVAV